MKRASKKLKAMSVAYSVAAEALDRFRASVFADDAIELARLTKISDDLYETMIAQATAEGLR